MRLGLDPAIGPGAEISETTLGRFVEIGEGCRLANVRFGDYSYCDRYADLANAEIGRFVSIASFARVGPTDHPMGQAAQHHFLYRSARFWADAEDDAAFFERRRARLTRIGHDVWIGHAAVVRPGLSVGTGAVIAAGAVVTRDVGPYEIVAGVPAAPIRSRFPKAIAERLIALAWWDWDHDRLRGALEEFRALSVEAFLERHGA